MKKHELTDEEKFCLEGCRSYTQYSRMRREFEMGRCAFCALDRELNTVIWEDEHLMVWHVHENFMREELRLHILIVPKRHVRFVAELTDEEAVSLVRAAQFAKEHFGYTGGLFHAREGDMRQNAGTVPHLHINIFEPLSTKEVRVPVFKDPTSREENQKRAIDFSRQYEDGADIQR